MQRMIPVTIGEAFGWLHLGDYRSRVAIVCPPLGYELAGAHQPLRILADQLADAGVPTLRLDYPGSGDALGMYEAVDLLAHRSAAIEAALDWMRKTFDAAGIALIGYRLGATAALDVAHRRREISHLALISPVLDGRAYVRDLQLTARLVARGAPTAASAEGGLETEGFHVSREQLSILGRLQRTGDAGPKGASILMLQEAPSARLAMCADALRQKANDVAVDHLEMPEGFRPGDVPPAAPLADIVKIVSFVATRDNPRKLPILVPAGFETELFRETALRFGDGRACCGVLCEPSRRVARGTIVILNTGATHHVGPGRSGVEHARALATEGFASFRIDIRGIGDGSWSAAGAGPSLYDEAGSGDVSAALDLLEARGLTNFALWGVCSGAYLALRTAQRDSRVHNVFAGNPQIFRASLARQRSLRGAAGSASTRDYLRKLSSASFWKRLARGEVSLARALRTGTLIGSRLGRAFQSALERYAGIAAGGGGREAFDMFADVSRRGGRVHLVYAAGDVGLEEFAIQTGACREDILGLPGVSFAVLEDCDHTFASRQARQCLRSYVMSAIALIDRQDRSRTVALRRGTVIRWAEAS